MRTSLWCLLCSGLLLTASACDNDPPHHVESQPSRYKIGEAAAGGLGTNPWSSSGGRVQIELSGALDYPSGEAALDGDIEVSIAISGGTALCGGGEARDLTGSGTVEADGDYLATVTTSGIAISGGTTGGACAGLSMNGGTLGVTLSQAADTDTCAAFCEGDEDEDACSEVCDGATWISGSTSVRRATLVREDASTRTLALDLTLDTLLDEDGEELSL